MITAVRQRRKTVRTNSEQFVDVLSGKGEAVLDWCGQEGPPEGVGVLS